MVVIKTAPQIAGIRRSCRLAVETLNLTAAAIRPGVKTGELNRLANDFMVKNQAIPATLGYGGYPKSICTSINSVVCHGIPSSGDILQVGDIINIDITTILDGYYGDVSACFPVGRISPPAQKLLAVTRQARDAAIAALKPGKYLNDCVGKIIEPLVTAQGFSVVRDLGGHGVGLKFHEDPFVYHFDTGFPGLLLKPGMIFTIEPMINASPDHRVKVDPNDGWTVRTFAGSLSAQFEHTVLITRHGSEILTK